MEDMLDLIEQADAVCNEWSVLCKDMKLELRSILWGAVATAMPSQNASAKSGDNPCPSPQQTKKRAKRLSSLQEGDDNNEVRGSLRISNSKILANIDEESRKSVESTVLPKPRTKASKSQSQETEKPTLNDNSQNGLMPPPAGPASAQHNTSYVEEHSFARPQRAAKLKSEKNLKEPKLNVKMRQPSSVDITKIKVEHEQRASEMHEVSKSNSTQSSKISMTTSKSDDTILVLPEKAPSLVILSGDDDEENANKENNINKDNEDVQDNGRQLRVKIKKEKFSICKDDETSTNILSNVVKPSESVNVSASTISILSATTTAQGKRNRKKKDMPLPIPIKVERVSSGDLVSESPISSRTRHGSIGRAASMEDDNPTSRSPSIYEDAIDKGTSTTRQEEVIGTNKSTGSAQGNETVTLSSGLPNGNDATFCSNAVQTTLQSSAAGQTTFVLGSGCGGFNATASMDKKSQSELVDATFNVAAAEGRDDAEQQQSFITAKHSLETARNDDSLLTEDESYGSEATPVAAPKQVAKPTKHSNKSDTINGTKLPLPGSAKFYKMPTRTNELFNPLVQSPLKKKVEAFENAVAEQSKPGRNKNSKDSAGMSSVTTPQIGKLHAPVLGRFLTPTQASNATPNMTAMGTKKAPNSASKVMAFPKLHTASNLKTTNSTSVKMFSRENSADEMRKGINQLTEERKRQREQKHFLAAQQREAKEKERAERLAKLAKEREEKRLKKQQEAELKKRELDEIQRKLRQPEEATAEAVRKAAAKKAIVDQERELLQHMKVQPQQNSANVKNKMLPPPPRIQMEYNFEMLHEDDSTDDEAKTSYKRPPPPTWSRSHVRGAAILLQQYWPTGIIDSFFSVQPTTPDLREIFPNIKESYLKRNSSVLWSTPPRYSELPKY